MYCVSCGPLAFFFLIIRGSNLPKTLTLPDALLVALTLSKALTLPKALTLHDALALPRPGFVFETLPPRGFRFEP
jgi:hypothetical protein